MPSLCAVVLSLNEERDLSRCLKSLSWCDELYVIDSGSSDRTQSIALEYGATFLTHIQEVPFLISEQRNWALDHAGITSDWVLFLDADEELGDNIKQHITHLLSINDQFDSFELCPRYWFLGKWLKYTQGFPNWHPRLVRRGRTHFVGGVWEKFAPYSNTGKIYIPYEHYAFSKGLDDWLIKHLRYADWDAHLVHKLLTCANTNQVELGSKPRLRLLSLLFWQLKPFSRFIYKYLICRGFMDGWQGLLYSLLMATYDIIVVIKVIELSRRSRGLTL